MRDKDGPLRDRFGKTLTAIVGEADRLFPESNSSPSLLESAARSLSSTIDRWGQNPSLRRFVGGVQRDTVTSAGEPVELTARVPMGSRRRASARFYVGDVAAGDVPIDGHSQVRVIKAAPGPGLYHVRVDLLDANGSVVLSLSGHRVLQVTGRRPVAIVDAELFLPSESDPRAAVINDLRALSADAFELVYFDIHEKNRELLIRGELKRQGLPSGAIVVYSAAEQELASLGVDFVSMFVSTGVRRLRAKGVPVTTILTERQADAEKAGAAQISVMTPAEAVARSRRGALRIEQERARDMLRERSETSRLDWYLNQTTGSRPLTGNRFRAEFDNKKAREVLFGAIETATATIHLQFYRIEPSRFVEALIVHLIRRARAGVKIRLMIDALYSEDELLGRVNPLIQSLRDERTVDVLAVAPIESPKDVTASTLKKRDHRKLVIIDGRQAFVSGRNAGDEYYLGFDEVPVHDHTPHDHIPWLDAHIEVSGPLVAEVQSTFVGTWREHGGAAIEPSGDADPRPAPEGNAKGRLVVHRGFADMNGLAMYEAMFDAAVHHVYIVNDFPFVPAIERGIFRLLARGVAVKLLTGNASARRDDGTLFPAPLHRTLFEYMVKAKLEPLLEAGVQIYEYRPPVQPMVVARGGRIRPYVHAKVVSVDGVVTSIGSANLDGTASYWESEANVVVQDEEFARGVEATLQGFIDESYRLDLDSAYWKSERAQRAVVSTLWPGTFYS